MIDKMNLFNGTSGNSNIASDSVISVNSHEEKLIAKAYLDIEGHIVLEFIDGVVLRDDLAVLFYNSVNDGINFTEEEARHWYYTRSSAPWIESRLQLLSVQYKNICKVLNPENLVSIFYEFKDNMYPLSLEISKLARDSILVDKHCIPTEIPNQPQVGFIGDLIDIEKGMFANLEIKIPDREEIKYLSWFRGYYMQVSNSREGDGCFGHSSRVYPNMVSTTKSIAKLSSSQAKIYLKTQVIECLSESRFNWAEIMNSTTKITSLVDLLLPRILNQ